MSAVGSGGVDTGRELLFVCALAPAGADVSDALTRLARGVERWDEFLGSVEVNQLHPRTAALLAGPSAPSTVPVSVRERLEEVARATAGRALFMAAELVRILEALRAARIDAVALKGPAFAELSGAGVTSRELTDLDVLIRPSEISRSVSALSALGYVCPLPPQAVRSRWMSRSTWELPLVNRGNGVLLELHWSLAPPWFPSPVSADDVLATAECRVFVGSRIAWPRAEELLLIHAADGMKSGGVGARWLSDVLALVRGRDVDWQRTVDIAERHGGLNIVRVALAVLDTLSSAAAGVVRLPSLAVDLPAAARRLREEARTSHRLAQAVTATCERLRMDRRIIGAVSHFRWSLQIADRPLAVAAAIGHYVSGPTIADLADMPADGLGDIRLRFRALRRRLIARARAV